MFKVFAFLKRNSELLSHDEYRAGHIGFHCCNSRRLTGIRGYIVNIWANEGLASKIGPDYKDIIINKNNMLTGKSILITGGTGSLGKELTKVILKN